jgi:hypothetical protein
MTELVPRETQPGLGSLGLSSGIFFLLIQKQLNQSPSGVPGPGPTVPGVCGILRPSDLIQMGCGQASRFFMVPQEPGCS